jgi:hypothetical protein
MQKWDTKTNTQISRKEEEKMENILSELRKPVTAPISEIIAHFITGLTIATLFLIPYVASLWSIMGLALFLRSNGTKSFLKDLIKQLLILATLGTFVGLELSANKYFLVPFGVMFMLVIAYRYVERYA